LKEGSVKIQQPLIL